jgi:HlyD family secretion protein
VVFLLLAAAGACNRKAEQRVPLQTAAVARRTIVAEATASGQVEPINVIEVKSKSSGQIVEMPVETGTQVKRGDLLVALDPRDVNQQLAQATADLKAAEIKLAVSKIQKERNDKMFAEKIITAQEYEASQLDFANSEAAVVRSRASLDLAQQRVEEATVRAPVAGTVLTKPVSLGQVIASATNSASGGTIVLTMADLSKVRVRALFNETDIGNVSVGQPATVTVDAFPDRPFRGVVEKKEPSAVVQSSVTMFPVLVTLDNLEGLLQPGMNGEVSVLVDRRENVLAVPNDAVRTTRDAMSTARLLGLDPDSVQASVQEQMRTSGGAGMRGGGEGLGNGNGNAAEGRGRRDNVSRGDVALTVASDDGQDGQDGGRRGGRQGGRQGFGQLPQVTDTDCQKVTAAFAKNPTAQSTLQGLRGRMQSGEIDMQGMRAISDSIYRVLEVDAGIARACQMRDRGQGGQGGRGADQTGGNASASTAAPGARTAGARTAAAAPQGVPVPAGELPAQRRGARAALVYVAEGEAIKPRVIRAGMSDLDYTEVVSGLEEGERVVLLAAVQMQAQRDSALARMRGMSSGGVPGMQRNAQGNTPIGGGPGRGRGN